MIVVRYVLPLLAGFCLLASEMPAAAQVIHDEKLWINTTVFGGIDDFAYFAEVQPRFGNGISQLDQILVRPAVGWKITKDLTIYQGYAYVETPLADGRTITENRSFQQISWMIGEVAGGNLSSRTRFEQREQSNGRDIGWRLRELLRFSLPLTEEKGGVAALGWTEAFVALNDTDWGARGGFDRIRTFVGLEVPVAGKSTIELGYINQTVNTPARGTGMDHIVSVNFFLRH